jgi:hypothetical protein
MAVAYTSGTTTDTYTTFTGSGSGYHHYSDSSMLIVESRMLAPDEWFFQDRNVETCTDIFYNPYTGERCSIDMYMIKEASKDFHFKLYGKKVNMYPYKGEPDRVTRHAAYSNRPTETKTPRSKDIELFKHIDGKDIKWNMEQQDWKPVGFKNELQYGLNKKVKNVLKGIKCQKPLNVKIKEVA